jgi:tetratricopeptide (TPR) repeat protein
MRTALPLFVIVAALFAGVVDASAAANISGDKQRVLSEIRKLEQKQVQYPFDADLHFILGNNYWILNDEKKTLEHYQRALLLDPDYDSVHWNLSSFYNQKGDGANAIRHMKKAEEIFLKREDLRSLASARKMLREFFVKYKYKPEEFEPRKGWLWKIFN